MQFIYMVSAFLCIGLINCDTLVGAPRKIDGEELESAKNLLTASLDELKGQEDGADLTLVRILSATVQVVAGKKYNIRAEFKNSENDIPKSCEILLWHRPWTGEHDTRLNCDDETKYNIIKSKTRSKRSLVGGPSDVDPETIEELRKNISECFVQLASEGKNKLQLKEVLGAQKQVVAGILYKVHTIVDTGDGPENCNIEVWCKPWIDFRQVTVECDSGATYKVVKDNREKRSSQLLRPLIPDYEQQQQQNDAELDADSAQSHFTQFKQNFGRVYQNDEEEAMRFRIFQNNLYLIRQLNKFEQGTAAYGVTEFADLTQDEYFQRTGLLKRNDDDELNNEIQNAFAEIPDIKLPKSHDWRDFNAVTPVKNQGNCGSCWAFSVTGNVEGLNAIKTGQLNAFSEQELVDCDDLDAGCNGGLPDNAVKFIEKEGGLEFESDYPYTAHRSKTCQYNPSKSRVQVSGVIDFKKGDEDGMAKWLTVNGPISIGINANAMQFYRGGISHPWKALCRASSLDHGVLIVGYGVAEYPAFNKTMPYWIVKNSWGPRWGEQGYYRVHRGDNTCGVSSMASSAVLAKSSSY